MERIKPFRPRMSQSVILITVAVFFAEAMMYPSIMKSQISVQDAITVGASYTPLIVKGQWWRMFSSMFLHTGFAHMASNMLVLMLMAAYVEMYFGSEAFLVIYILSGFGAEAVTMLAELYLNTYDVSMGASGAVFGVAASYFIISAKRSVHSRIPPEAVAAGTAIMLIQSFSNGRVNIYSHIGGFVTGLFVSYCMDMMRNKSKIYTTGVKKKTKKSIKKRRKTGR